MTAKGEFLQYFQVKYILWWKQSQSWASRVIEDAVILCSLLLLGGQELRGHFAQFLRRNGIEESDEWLRNDRFSG